MLKVDVINDAYSQLRISGLTTDPNPEELETALSRLESMMAEWSSRNICSHYNFEDQPDPNSITNLSLAYLQATSTNLATRLIPDFNITPSPVLLKQATQSLSGVSSLAARERLREVNYPVRQPRGSGSTLRYNRWQRFYRQPAEADNRCTTIYMKVGDINDFTEHFDDYLNKQEFIDTYTIDSSSGLTLSNDSNTETDVLYRIEAKNNTSGGYQTVSIEILTTNGRVTQRLVQFEVS